MTQTSTDQVQKLKAAETAVDEGAEGSNASIRESLSALVDNEASEMEIHRLLKVAESDPAIKASWRRYQLVRSVLKNDLAVDPQLDLSQRISAAIAEETPLATATSRLKQWRDGVGKVAIAASVTFAFILGVQQFGPQGELESMQTTASAGPATSEPIEVAVGAPSGFELPSFAARTVSTDPNAQANAGVPRPNSYSQQMSDAQLQSNQALQNHFNRLLIRHAERSSANGSMGLIPFARVSQMEAAQE